MRTVTFANLDLAQYLERNFILVWDNQAPYPAANNQEALAQREMASYPEGSGGSNVRSYFCTANDEIVLLLEGYWSAERYLALAKFVRELGDQVTAQHQDEQVKALQKALRAHAQFVARERDLLAPAKTPDAEVQKKAAALTSLQNSFHNSIPLAFKPAQGFLNQKWNERILR